ncbi:MAG: LysR substrate-binding domain-containing protein [Chloroflexota bacterium]
MTFQQAGMNLSQLRTCLMVVDSGSLSAAAEKSGVSQSGISRQVKRLEEEIGVELLERDTTGVRPTPEGELLVDFARRTVDGYDDLLNSVRNPEAPLSGRLRIAASTTPGEFLVPELATEFSMAYPLVTPEVSVTDTARVVEEVLERRWDVGFVGRPTEHRRLACRPVATDEIVLAAPRDHPFAEREVVSLNDLESERFIEREEGSGTRLSVLDELGRRGLRMPPYRVALILGTTQAVVSAVSAGLGVGFVTERALDRYSRDRIRAVRIEEATFLRSLYLIYDVERPLPALVRTFLNFVEKRLDRGEL